MGSARVFRFVHAVPKAHDTLFALDRIANIWFGITHLANAQEHAHYLFVGATVQRARKGADGRGDRGIHVSKSASRYTSGKSRCVQLMIGVQDQSHVKDVCSVFIGHFTLEHIKKVGCSVVIAQRGDWLSAIADVFPGGHNRP